VGVAARRERFEDFELTGTRDPSGAQQGRVHMPDERASPRAPREGDVTPGAFVPGYMPRRFARLTSKAAGPSPGQSLVPGDGMCLSSFLILTDPGDPSRVLLGKIAPGPAWEEAGGIDPARAARIASGWMLPASQLLLFESPADAAGRIASELLGVPLGPVPSPTVFSETYRRAGAETADPHWDLHFLFRAPGPDRAPTHRLWQELAYLEPRRLLRSEFARNHGDILELAGFSLAPDAVAPGTG
jgi:hypothetical protein